MSNRTWLGAVYEDHRAGLFLAAWTVLRRSDLAEDAVHSAFVKLARLASPPEDPKLFVFRAVRNAAIDLARLRARRREEPLPADWDPPTAESSHAQAEISLAALIDGLDAPSREVVELHLHGALTFREISQLLAEPLATVASRYRRALEKLGNQLKVRHE
jgi:RNA polymerase sigma-70 factor (ECF subfamily)